METIQGYTDRVALIDLGANHPDEKLTGFHAVVCHGTANPSDGATAQMHHDYWNTGGAGRHVSSVHAVFDKDEGILLVPIDYVTWNLADGADQPATDESFFTVAWEVCEIASYTAAQFQAACQRAARFTAKVLLAYGKTPIEGVTVRKHGSYPTTTHIHCPAFLNAGTHGLTWAQFVALVQQEYAALTVSPLRPLNGFTLGFGFRAFYEALDTLGHDTAKRTLGLPRSNEYLAKDAQGVECTAQDFERATLLYYPNVQGDYQIVCAFRTATITPRA